jgi:hypothetical protein
VTARADEAHDVWGDLAPVTGVLNVNALVLVVDGKDLGSVHGR